MTETLKKTERKTIVVSAVNLVEAGTLAILRECLAYLSILAGQGGYRIVAVVYKRELADFPNIEYIETQWPKKRWINRVWFEYVGMKRVSKRLSPVHLWLSLHDTTPTVCAERRAVYCHNSYSFYKWKLHDWIFSPKIALFALFTKFIYRTNIHKNSYLIVQQEWFRKGMHRMFNYAMSQIIVAPPTGDRMNHQTIDTVNKIDKRCHFIFAASPNSHKNFEVICRAAHLLQQSSITNFAVDITVKGDENRYARWLYKHWGKLNNLNFIGFLDRQKLYQKYAESQCLIFPSKVETWGLPISEFAGFDKPMLLADLPYAHETAAGSEKVSFFDPDSPAQLAELMRKLINGDQSVLKSVPQVALAEPVAKDWKELFEILLK